MRELNSDLLALGVRELDDALEAELTLELAVGPDASVFGRDAALGQDGRGLDDGETRPARDDATQVGLVPGPEMPIFTRVLAQWRQEDAILKGRTADRERLEELGDGLVVWLGVCGCSGGRVLSWGEVGDLNVYVS